MKKLIILMVLLVAHHFCFSQSGFPGYSGPIGNPGTLTDNAGAFRAKKGFVIGQYIDTTAANADYIDFYPGAIIYTYKLPSDSGSIWIRDGLGKKWLFSLNSTYQQFIVNNIYNNSIVTTNIFNDSLLILCTGAGACDTINLGNTYNSYYFLNDTSAVVCTQPQVVCVGDTCNTQQVCDTISVPRQKLYIFQNGVQQVSGGIVEHGSYSSAGSTPSVLKHETYLYTDYLYQILGARLANEIFSVKQRQGVPASGSIASFLHGGNGTNPSIIDYDNRVKLWVNYTNPFHGDSAGYMWNRTGYYLGVNTRGSSNSIGIDNLLSKQTGIMFHTLDTANTDAVTIFGTKTPKTIPLFNGTNPSSFYDNRIAVYKTTGQIQNPFYTNNGTFEVDDTTNYKPGAYDASGNFFRFNHWPVGAGGGGGAWGSITGTLSNQTDLQAALDNKWGITGNTLSATGIFGSLNDYDVNLKRNNVSFLNLIKSGGVSWVQIPLQVGLGNNPQPPPTSTGFYIQPGTYFGYPFTDLMSDSSAWRLGTFSLYGNKDAFMIWRPNVSGSTRTDDYAVMEAQQYAGLRLGTYQSSDGVAVDIERSNRIWFRADSNRFEKRISYTGNIHGTFGPYSLVTKAYGDSAWAGGTDTHFGNTNLTQTANRTFSGAGFTYTFNNLGTWTYNWGSSNLTAYEGSISLSGATAGGSGNPFITLSSDNLTYAQTSLGTNGPKFNNQIVFGEETDGTFISSTNLSIGTGVNSNITMYGDSALFRFFKGQATLDSLRMANSDTAGYKPMVWNIHNKSWRYFNSWGELGLGGGGGVPTSRLVSTGYGLTGGGDLTIDRTHVFDSATVFSQLTWQRVLLNEYQGGMYSPNLNDRLEIDMDGNPFGIVDVNDFFIDLNTNEWAIQGAGGGSMTSTIISQDGWLGEMRILRSVSASKFTEIRLPADSLLLFPDQGRIYLDSLRTSTDVNRIIGWSSYNGGVSQITIGSGLNLTPAGVLSATGGGGENLQQTLDLGSTLTSSETITVGANILTITGSTTGFGNGSLKTVNTAGGNAIWVSSSGGATNNTGIASYINEANKTNIAVSGSSEGTGSAVNYGVSGSASGGSSNFASSFVANSASANNYGINAVASGASSTNYAGFFQASGGTNNYSIITNGGNVGIGDVTPASLLTVGSGDVFQVNSSGDIVKIKNLTYSWPASHTTNGFLKNDGSGNLTWETVSGVSDGDKGDITVTASGATWTIDPGVVTFSKMQAITDNRLLGAQGGTTVEEISLTANDFDLATNNLSIDYTNGQAASGSTKGFLTSADWTTFNEKVNKTGTPSNIQIAVWTNSSTIQGTSSLTFDGTTIAAPNFRTDLSRVTIGENGGNGQGAIYLQDASGNANTYLAEYLELKEQSAPGTPATSFGRLYNKTDGKLYWKDDAGTEYDLTATGGGGVSDGDKGDITVSGSGATWTVDVDIAKTWTSKHSFTGGFATTSFNTITSGTSSTVGDNITTVIFNPASVLATYTLTLPASPVDGQYIYIRFGGTVAAGADVVTALTITASQSIYQAITPTQAKGGDEIIYQYEATGTTYKRIK